MSQRKSVKKIAPDVPFNSYEQNQLIHPGSTPVKKSSKTGKPSDFSESLINLTSDEKRHDVGGDYVGATYIEKINPFAHHQDLH